MAFIGKGRPGGPGGNKVPPNLGGDAVRKSRPSPTPGSAQSTGKVGSTDDATRKARPKSSGSGQSTATRGGY